MKREPKAVWPLERSVRPAYTAPRGYPPFTHLAGGGTDAVSTASVLLESFQYGRQRK